MNIDTWVEERDARLIDQMYSTQTVLCDECKEKEFNEEDAYVSKYFKKLNFCSEKCRDKFDKNYEEE
jgi:hypothetical protein